MKRRILSLILALVMVFSAVPMAAAADGDVAQIGGTTYATLQAAIDAAGTDDTVTLLQDITLTEDNRVAGADRNVLLNVAGKDITLDMNEKKISVVHEDTFAEDYIVAVICVADGAGLTVTGNGTIDVKVKDLEPDVAYMFWKRGTTGHLTIENGTYHMNDTADSMVYTNDNGGEIVTIKGGTWTLDSVNTRGDNDEPWIFNVQGAGDNHIVVTGGTFNAEINRQKWANEVMVPVTHYVENNESTWTVKSGSALYVTEGILTGPYYIEDWRIGYPSLKAFFVAADADNEDTIDRYDPITLLKDSVITDSVDLSKTPIDQNGNSITLEENGTLTVAADATVVPVAADGYELVKTVNADGTITYSVEKMALSVKFRDRFGNTTGDQVTVKYNDLEEVVLSIPAAFANDHYGYVLACWNSKSDGTGEYDFPVDQPLTAEQIETLVRLAQKNNGVVTLNAFDWVYDTFTVRFRNFVNGKLERDTMYTQPATYNTELTLIPNEFERVGYNFVGWNSKSDGKGKYDLEDGAVIPAVRAEDSQLDVNGMYEYSRTHDGEYTLNAQWEADTFIIRFRNFVDGKLTGTVYEQVATYDQALELKANQFKRNGYTFSHWNSSSKGNGNYNYDNLATIEAERINDMYVYAQENNGVYTLNAQWTPNNYTVTLDVNGGDALEKNTITTTTDAPYGELPTPTKHGYNFVGWFNGETEVTAESIAPWGNHTLTAKWAQDTFQIVFRNWYNNTNNGTIPQTATYDEELTLRANSFKRTGYTFDHWNSKRDTDDGNFTFADQAVVDVDTINAMYDYAQANGGKAYLNTYWTANQYEVSFDTGFEDITVDPITVTFDSAYGTLPTLERLGYEFLGWTLNGEPVDADTIVKTAENHTLTAQWEKVVFNITVDEPENGTIVVKVNGEEATGTTIQATVGDKIEVTVTPDEHYEIGLAKWSYPNHSTLEYGSFSFTMPAEDVTVSARFDAIMYTVDAVQPEHGAIKVTANGEELTLPTSVQSGTELEVEFTADEGYEVSYRRMTIGNTTTMLYKDIVTKTVDADVTFYATVTPKEYTITFDTDGGSAVAPITQDYGTAVTAPEDPTKTGYTFAGWDVEIPATMPAGDMTITAKWTINQYTITFDTDGGSAVAAITADYGTAVEAPEDPTKTGYTFAGWTPNVPATMPAENVTVKAQWTINQYTITFDTVGGTEIAPITQDYGTAVPKIDDPEKTNYVFAGWDKDIPATMPAEDMTITALWNRDLSVATIEVLNEDELVYNGKAQEPTIVVEHDGDILTEGFTVSYTNNIKAGIATVTITAVEGSDCENSTSATFEIKKADLTVTAHNQVVEIYSKPLKLNDGINYTITGRVDNDPVYVTLSTNANYEKLGTYTIFVDAAASSNYNVFEVNGTLTVKQRMVHVGGGIHINGLWNNPFIDVDADDWFYGDVQYVYENGLMNGVSSNEFDPYGKVNRAMVVTTLWRMQGSPEVLNAPTFTDVAEGQWYAKAVAWAAANGIVNGMGDGTFAPLDAVTREQVAAMLNRYADYKGWKVEAKDTEAYIHSAWAEENVDWAETVGLFDDLGVNVRDLTKAANRAELAAYLTRFCENVAK